MTRFIARRLLAAVPLLLGISVVSFAILLAVPGGPTAAYATDPNITAEDIRRLEEAFGLDRPLHIQYAGWLSRFVSGDWGYSFSSHEPVLGLILERLPNTLALTVIAYLVVLLVALPVGILAATRQYSWVDHLVTGATFAFLSMPTFWLGLLLLIAFGLELRWLPLGGVQTVGAPFDLLDRLRHLVLPVATLALVQIGSYARFLRASLLETIDQDYIRTARAKGLVERVVVGRHAVRNASIPLVTIAALDLPDIFAGALVTEQIFGWPGMGRLFWDAATRADYPVLMGILAVTATLIVLANLVADVLYAYLDPRIRYG